MMNKQKFVCFSIHYQFSVYVLVYQLRLWIFVWNSSWCSQLNILILFFQAHSNAFKHNKNRHLDNNQIFWYNHLHGHCQFYEWKNALYEPVSFIIFSSSVRNVTGEAFSTVPVLYIIWGRFKALHICCIKINSINYIRSIWFEKEKKNCCFHLW